MKLVEDTENTSKESEKISEKEAEEAFIKIIKWVGEDPSREGLASTPKRLVKAYKEYFKGYSEDPKKLLEKTFGDVKGYDDMIIQKKYFSSKSLRTSHGTNYWSGTYSIYTKFKSSWLKQTC